MNFQVPVEKRAVEKSKTFIATTQAFSFLCLFKDISENRGNNISVSLCVCVAWLALVCFLLNLLYWFEKSAVTPEAKNPIKMRVLKFRAEDSHPV